MAPILADNIPRWGRGRVDTFNPYKAIQFNWDLNRLPPSELLGASDFPSLWNQKPREGMHLHWDGDNDSVDERNLSAALGAGVTPVTVDHDSLKRVRDWIWTLPPPKYPYAVDHALADRGAPLYQQHCLACHADARFRDGLTSDSRVGQVEPIEGIATDRHRLDSYLGLRREPDGTHPVRVRFALPEDERLRQPATRWHLAPRSYLHNGSVPTLRTCSIPGPATEGFLSRVRCLRPGPGRLRLERASRRQSGVHAVRHGRAGQRQWRARYGTALMPDEKQAIVEYMKTF
jgi:hypothetical protein